MLGDLPVIMGSLNNNQNQKEHSNPDAASSGGVEPSIPVNYGAQFLDAVRENDRDTLCRLANLLTSKCRIFTASVPSLTRGLFDENPSVRTNAAYLLSEGFHWIHADDLNSWVLPSVTRALGTLDPHGSLIWLSKKVGFVANQISQENIEKFVSHGVQAFQEVDVELAGLVTIAPFGNRLEKNVRRNVLETVCDVLQTLTKLFADPNESPDLRDRDPLRMMLPSIGVSILNFTSPIEHLRARSSDIHSKDLELMERLDGALFQYVKSAIGHSVHKCRPLSVEDKSVILPVAASMGNTSLEWNSLFSELERQMHNHRDPFSTVLCRLTGGRRIADPLTVITQARDELLNGHDFFLVVSTLENAYSSLIRCSLQGRKQLLACMELLQEIEELTLSSYVAFFAQRVKEVLSHT
jgi:hypothetical protein